MSKKLVSSSTNDETKDFPLLLKDYSPDSCIIFDQIAFRFRKDNLD